MIGLRCSVAMQRRRQRAGCHKWQFCRRRLLPKAVSHFLGTVKGQYHFGVALALQNIPDWAHAPRPTLSFQRQFREIGFSYLHNVRLTSAQFRQNVQGPTPAMEDPEDMKRRVVKVSAVSRHRQRPCPTLAPGYAIRGRRGRGRTAARRTPRVFVSAHSSGACGDPPRAPRKYGITGGAPSRAARDTAARGRDGPIPRAPRAGPVAASGASLEAAARGAITNSRKGPARAPGPGAAGCGDPRTRAGCARAAFCWGRRPRNTVRVGFLRGCAAKGGRRARPSRARWARRFGAHAANMPFPARASRARVRSLIIAFERKVRRGRWDQRGRF